jgi:hypothetical protein
MNIPKKSVPITVPTTPIKPTTPKAALVGIPSFHKKAIAPTIKISAVETPIEPAQEETIQVSYIEEIEETLNRKDRRRLTKGRKLKPSDESLSQKIEIAFLIKLGKKYPNNADIALERDKRIHPKKYKGAKAPA